VGAICILVVSGPCGQCSSSMTARLRTERGGISSILFAAARRQPEELDLVDHPHFAGEAGIATLIGLILDYRLHRPGTDIRSSPQAPLNPAG
jgi:hypothetical protein